ncbi:MAG: dephospho-CoA kinase [Candidatus Acetothermia bacterium]
MKTVALTGGIASGKTVVLDEIDRNFDGVVTIQADDLAKEIYQPSNPNYEDVIDLLGPDVANESGTVDSEKVADIVFDDTEKLRKLEEVAHPYVVRKIEELSGYYRKKGTELLLVEIPLFFQSSRIDRNSFDLVLLVTASRGRRVDRLMDRDGLNRSEAERRIDLQALPKDAREKADHVIETNRDVEEARRKAREFASELLGA